MSKREEDFEKYAMDYCEDHSHCIYFEAGAEYGYQYAVEKIFKCIEDQAIFGWIEDIEVDKFLEKIRKAMEE